MHQKAQLGKFMGGTVPLGYKIDEDKNNIRGSIQKISTSESSIKVYVIPTDEELMIARDTLELINS